MVRDPIATWKEPSESATIAQVVTILGQIQLLGQITQDRNLCTSPSLTAETLICSASLLCVPLLSGGWKEQSCLETALTFASFKKLPADEDNGGQFGEQRERLSRGYISEKGHKC